MKLSDNKYSIRDGSINGLQLELYDLKHEFEKCYGVRIYSERYKHQGEFKHNLLLMDASDLSIPRCNLFDLLGEKQSKINCICVFKTEDIESANKIKDKISFYNNKVSDIFMVI